MLRSPRPRPQRAPSSGEERVELAVAILDADLHAASDERVAGLEAVGQRRCSEPATAPWEVLEDETPQRHVVGHRLVGEGLDDELVGSDLVEATPKPVLLVASNRDVTPLAAGAAVPPVDAGGVEAVGADPLLAA
jgi:hypothetical protein